MHEEKCINPTLQGNWKGALCNVVCFVFCLLPVDRSAEEFQWLLDMVQNDPVHYVRSVMLFVEYNEYFLLQYTQLL